MHIVADVKRMKIEVLISGFGGQGLMSLGKILAKAALYENKYTTWFPSYGAEMRGGTAHCFVKISDSPIASPFVNSPDIAFIFNQPSLDKFKKYFKKETLVILNADLISKVSLGKDIQKFNIPLNKIALECGNIKVANIVALGFLISFKKDLFKKQTIIKVLEEMFNTKDNLEINLQGFERGLKATPADFF